MALLKRKKKAKYLVGIDEAGRGPIAGPVAVGVLVFLAPEARYFFRGVKESKQLSHEEREVWFEKINKIKGFGLLNYQVGFSSREVIDEKGLTFAIKHALRFGIENLKLKPEHCEVLLDGGLKAPVEYENQKTIIKGDEKKMIIALASICAKVLRDRKMVELGKHFPAYGFESHKGYGTPEHYEAIKKYGLISEHRRLFLKGF